MRNNYDYPYGWGKNNMMDYYMRRGGNTFLRSLQSQLGLYNVGDKVIGKVTSKVIEEGKNYFGTSFNFKAKDSVSVIKWIASHDHKFTSHINNPQVLENGMNSQVISQISMVNKEFIIKLDKGTFAYVSSMDDMHKYSNSVFVYANNANSDEGNAGFENMDIYIFGKKMRKYAAELASATNVVMGTLCQYIVMGGKEKNEYTISAKEINPRPLDSLFFDSDIKEKITSHIDKWLDNESLYRDRSLLFKTGILLEGEPGTGKSSLVVALASAYNMEIVNINMPSFRNIDIDRVIESINADNNKYIVLLEEIDCVFNSADRDDKDIDKDDKTFISDLLQFIDSPKSPNNVIFIATTNYPDKLDKALTRKGRFDLTVDVNSLHNPDSVIKMCKSFDLADDQIKDILKNNPLPITQSALQVEILQRIENKPLFDDSTNEDTENKNIETVEIPVWVFQHLRLKSDSISNIYFRLAGEIPKTATQLNMYKETYINVYTLKKNIYFEIPKDTVLAIPNDDLIVNILSPTPQTPCKLEIANNAKKFITRF